MRTPKRILERRRSVRVEESLPFTIGHDGFEIEARTLNLSVGGAMCLLDKPLAPMTRLKIALSLPGRANGTHHVVRATGVVVRSDADPATGKYHVAIFFSDVREEERKHILNFVERRIQP